MDYQLADLAIFSVQRGFFFVLVALIEAGFLVSILAFSLRHNCSLSEFRCYQVCFFFYIDGCEQQNFPVKR